MVSSVSYPHLWSYGGTVFPAIKPESSSVDVDERMETAPQTETMTFDRGFDAQKPSQGLATVSEHQQQQPIQLDSIIQDFRSTMVALGADDTVKSEVDVYLQAVSLQGQKDKPDVSYIRQSLKTSAKSLDQFISTALNQPAKVVSDWVDALLLQPITYKTTEKEKPLSQTDASPADAEIEGGTSEGSSDRSQLKLWIQQGRQALQQQHPETAVTYFEQALAVTDSDSSPLLKGKVWCLAAQGYEASNQPDKALTAYGKAEALFDDAGEETRLVGVLQRQAELYETLGQPQMAIDAVETAIDVVGDIPPNTIRSSLETELLNKVGLLYWQTGDATSAKDSFEAALTLANDINDPLLQTDIHSNLGAWYRADRQYDTAIQQYQQALQLARSAGDPESVAAVQAQLRETVSTWQSLQTV